MKKTLFTIMAAALALSACQKSDQPVNGAEKEEANTITVTALATNATDTKVTMGAKAGDAYPASWNNSECTYLREVVVGLASSTDPSDSVRHLCSDSFSKTDSHNGTFTFTLPSTPSYSYHYVAVYPGVQDKPKGSPNHGVRYSGSDSKNRVSYILNHTANQVPAADGPDQSTHIYIAKDMNHSTQATSLNLPFQSVVSYGKMTVKNFPALAPGETVSKITITAPDKIMTGRLYHYFRATETYPVDTTIAYTTDKGVPQVKPYVMIDPQNITFNTTGFDVWFTTLPFSMAAGDNLYLTVETSVQTYQVRLAISKPISFTAGKVSEFTYNYTKAVQQKVLTFDFSTCPAGWPNGETDYKSKNHEELNYTYTLNGTAYGFTTATCLEISASSTRSIAWGYDGSKTPTQYFTIQSHRFLGLPKIEEYKLVTLEFTQACSDKSRKACVTTEITKQNDQEKHTVTGGEPISVGTIGTKYIFNLSNTAANTRYYFAPCSYASGFNTLTLVYEEVK